MAATRTYKESCALAHSLDLVGERWVLLIIRELMFGPRRFTDLQTRLTAASSSVLTDRLHKLADAGIVTRRRLPRPAASWVYELSERGYGLQPAMLALAQWGRQSPNRNGDLTTTPAAIAMSLLAHFDPSRAHNLELVVDLELDGDGFRASVGNGRLLIGPCQGTPAPVLVRLNEPNTKALTRAAGATAQELIAEGAEIEGDPALVTQFLGTLTG